MSSLEWRKSSYSGGMENACLEVRDGAPGVVPVRDSKVPGGPALTVPAAAWTGFVRHVRRTA
ncbi:DUF397 domain-containing protein [Streptomyces sp. ST2-7A]|uniref:DUF397 domain-containing protein n=1 Tax=Streptomyces sp. ST2-7A TaxID=2907214 RepID=UPI001F17BF7D|nr:DUF397 domain-containing protein [Streptomyces sp. ST2-7A]MCE7079263.1 DUF397 domain-containing protein [Streptomyces sp. ST2-7A]